MTQYARIKLTSSNLEQLDLLAKEIKDITEKTGVKTKGPQPLPTKRLKITHAKGARPARVRIRSTTGS